MAHLIVRLDWLDTMKCARHYSPPPHVLAETTVECKITNRGDETFQAKMSATLTF